MAETWTVYLSTGLVVPTLKDKIVATALNICFLKIKPTNAKTVTPRDKAVTVGYSD